MHQFIIDHVQDSPERQAILRTACLLYFLICSVPVHVAIALFDMYTSTQLNCNTALETFSMLIASHVLGQSLPNVVCGISTSCSTFVLSFLSIKLVVQSVDFNHLLQHYD
jgi:hypothetical protein